MEEENHYLCCVFLVGAFRKKRRLLAFLKDQRGDRFYELYKLAPSATLNSCLLLPLGLEGIRIF